MYDSRADAEAAQRQLESLGILDADGVSIHDQSSTGLSAGSSGYSSHENRGFWSGLKDMFLPDEDRHFYEEGVRRGGYLLTVRVDEQQADRVHDVLENSNAVNVDEREQSLRSSGWAPATAAMGGTATGAGMATGAATGSAGYAAASVPNTARTTGTEEHIPVVEEQLAVGKREVSRGGVRVRSYVREVPVHEQVSLREEHVDVERRPVNQPLTGANLTGDAFQERSIEVTETAEEAVVAKNARIVEEVVVRKGVEERVEQIDDTVRRTEVDVERLADNDRIGTDRLAAGGATSMTGGTLGNDRDGDGLNDRIDPDRNNDGIVDRDRLR
jgi:uncharacterized protein (TIGR02271 family)